ncbi:MAG: sulfotransferase family protein [Desulfobacterales bacterium]|nr:sulfotransferase family protein [Desulfobacterales bacterium]
MNKIIALWTHPRSISTAMERVMMERGDLKILHEPFSYLYYVHEGKATIPQEYRDPNHPTEYPPIKEHIISSAEQSPVFFKDMCSHCHNDLSKDDEFLKRLTNTFLIRDPAKAIASYYAMNQKVTLEEIGYEQELKIFEKVADLTGKQPVVIDADDLEDNPEGVVRAYCNALDIPFISESLYWDAGHKEEWDIWKKWHADAAKSCGIQKNMETFEVTIDNSDHLKSYYDYHLPLYEAMYKYRTVASD